MQAADQVRVATEPRRLEILQLIWDRERSVGDIAARVPVSMAAVSQHLAKLKDAGLVSVRREGRRRFYVARRSDLGTLAIVLESFWRDRLDALDRLARSIETGSTDDTEPPRTPRRPSS